MIKELGPPLNQMHIKAHPLHTMIAAAGGLPGFGGTSTPLPE